MATVRPVADRDIPHISTLYRDVYGDDYPFKEFYDTEWIKRGVYDSSIRWFVAAEESGRLLGSSAIMLAAGDADDLISEIGRLVVHPDARGMGLATKLVQAVIDEADLLSDFAFAECRTAHLGSQIIFDRLGFSILGIEPLVYELGGHESVVYVARLSEAARVLRKGNPTVIPEVFELASHALSNCGLPVDVAAHPLPEPYPALRDGDGVTLEKLQDRQQFRLLRLSRDNFLNPEIFGSVRLEHGHLKLKKYNATYLVLRRRDAVLGGLGFTWDEVDRKVKIFELVSTDPRAKGTLLTRAMEWMERELDPRYVSIDVNAHAHRMQQSLHLLGFAPVTYAPSMVYVMGERFDVVRMVKLRQEPKLRHWKLTEQAAYAGELGERALFAVSKSAELDRSARRVQIFEALTDTQIGIVTAVAREVTYDAGATIFESGTQEQALFVVLDGAVDIVRAGSHTPVATLGVGETFGEMALIEELPRSAGAVARDDARLLVLQPGDFDQLLLRDPEAGVIILRNLAKTLSRRLRSESE